MNDLEAIKTETDFSEKEIYNLYYRFQQLDEKQQNRISINQFLQLSELYNSPYKSRLIEALDLVKDYQNYASQENEPPNQQVNVKSKNANEKPKLTILKNQQNFLKQTVYKVVPMNTQITQQKEEEERNNKLNNQQLNVPFINFKIFCKKLNVFAPNAQISQKAKFLFKIYDIDNDGSLNKQDLMVGIGLLFTDPHTKERLVNKNEIETIVEQIFVETDRSQEGNLKFEDFQLYLWETDFEKNCMYYAPSSERFSQGFDLLRKRAPILGGNFAIWGGLYTTTECILIYARQVEDIWNRIAGGFITGATLAIRGGYKTALQQGIFGGLFLGSFSLVEIAMMKMQKKQEQEHWQQMYEEQIKIQTDHLKQTRPDIYAEIEKQEMRRKRQQQLQEQAANKQLAY